MKIELKNIHKTMLITALGTFVVCSGVKLYFSSQIAIKSIEVSDLFERKASLEEEIAGLEYKKAEVSSMKLVESKAKKLGFIEMSENIIAVTPVSGTPVASLSY